jgi:hypothetical protein
MLSNRSRVQILAATIAIAGVGATAGLATAQSDSQALTGVTVEQSEVTRHRALGQLGEELRVISDSAVIARHRALGRLPLAGPAGVTSSEAGSSRWSSWEASVFGVTALAACLLIGFALMRSGRVRTRGGA